MCNSVSTNLQSSSQLKQPFTSRRVPWRLGSAIWWTQPSQRRNASSVWRSGSLYWTLQPRRYGRLLRLSSPPVGPTSLSCTSQNQQRHLPASFLLLKPHIEESKLRKMYRWEMLRGWGMWWEITLDSNWEIRESDEVLKKTFRTIN